MTALVPRPLVLGKPAKRPAALRARVKPLPTPAQVDGAALLAVGPRVVCPFPPTALSPNARGHWSKRSRAAAAYRRECWALALAAGLTPALLAGEAGQIELFLDFFPPNRARRDDDNAIAAFKAGRDGIADALKVDDARFRAFPTMHAAPLGCVVATLCGLAGGADA